MFKFKEYDHTLFKIKRKVVGISATELSDICFMTRQTLYRIEAGLSKNKAAITLVGIALDEIAENTGFSQVFDILEKGYKV